MKPSTMGFRSTSNSTESNRLKKSSSSNFANKMKSSISNITSCMDSSIKQRTNNSKSNKKTMLSSQNSNKSLKTLNQTQSQIRLDNTKKVGGRRIEAVVSQNDKKTTVNVKNMKQKAIGSSNPTMINSYKTKTRQTEQKENQDQYMKNAQRNNAGKKMFAPQHHSRKNLR